MVIPFSPAECGAWTHGHALKRRALYQTELIRLWYFRAPIYQRWDLNPRSFTQQNLNLPPLTGLGYTGIPCSPEYLVLPTFYNRLHLILWCIITAHQATLRIGIEPMTSRLTVARSNQLSYQSLSLIPTTGLEPVSPRWKRGILNHLD